MLGDTPAQAQEHARYIRRQQVSPQTAILLLEQVWNTDLPGFDAGGRCRRSTPTRRRARSSRAARMYDDPAAVARK